MAVKGGIWRSVDTTAKRCHRYEIHFMGVRKNFRLIIVSMIAKSAAARPSKTLKNGGAARAIRIIRVDRAKPEFRKTA